MQNTKPKFKWHNEVIAWLNGEVVQWRVHRGRPWEDMEIEQGDALPNFYTYREYRIKPKKVVKYAGIYDRKENVATSDTEFESIDALKEYAYHNNDWNCSRTKFQKRTYLDGELIDLELVKV